MQGWVALAFPVMYCLMCLVISRLRAQLGPPSHSAWGAMPTYLLPAMAGTRALGPHTMGVFMLLSPYCEEQRSNPSPISLEALKMSEDGRMERKRITVALAVVVPLTILCYFWANIHFGYRIGLAAKTTAAWQLSFARTRTGMLDAALHDPQGPNVLGASAIGIGAIVTLLLTYLRLRFLWWPLHPVAFPIAFSSAIQSMTVPILLTWLVKALLLRYGGIRAHRAALPFFLGLLAGQGTIALLQRLVFGALHVDY